MRYRWGMYTSTLISLSRDTVLGSDPSAGTADLLNADLRHAEHTALPIIRDNKALVQCIADALLRASELTGPDLQRLLEEGVGPGEPTKDGPHNPPPRTALSADVGTDLGTDVRVGLSADVSAHVGAAVAAEVSLKVITDVSVKRY